MIPIRTTVIPIHPCTHTRSTRKEKWLFGTPDHKIAEYDNKKFLETGRRGGNLRRKRQLEKYNAYKEELRWLVKKLGFEMPMGYFAIWFYVPYPVSWRKKLIEKNLYKPHENTPDCDNMIKAFLDGVLPRKNKSKGETGSDDRKVHCYAAFKVWVKMNEACIKIVEYEKNDFIKLFEHGHPTYSTSHTLSENY